MPESKFSFELIAQNDSARLGKITTSKGVIDTPAFMPVGTQGTVKGIFPEDTSAEAELDYDDLTCDEDSFQNYEGIEQRTLSSIQEALVKLPQYGIINLMF